MISPAGKGVLSIRCCSSTQGGPLAPLAALAALPTSWHQGGRGVLSRARGAAQ